MICTGKFYSATGTSRLTTTGTSRLTTLNSVAYYKEITLRNGKKKILLDNKSLLKKFPIYLAFMRI